MLDLIFSNLGTVLNTKHQPRIVQKPLCFLALLREKKLRDRSKYEMAQFDPTHYPKLGYIPVSAKIFQEEQWR